MSTSSLAGCTLSSPSLSLRYRLFELFFCMRVLPALPAAPSRVRMYTPSSTFLFDVSRQFVRRHGCAVGRGPERVCVRLWVAGYQESGGFSRDRV